MPEEFYYRKQIVEILDCSEELIDRLEEEELVFSVPRSDSLERVYPVDQVERIRVANNLVRDLDVNVPGCAVILEMRTSMLEMQRRFDKILEILRDRLKHTEEP